MSATEELRRLLDERGVEYEVRVENITGIEHIIWHTDEFSQWDWDEEFGTGWLNGWQHDVTPEQAIAATLGSEEAYTREDVEGAFVSGYSLGSLPVGSDPRWDENSQMVDEHMAEHSWVRLPVDADGVPIRVGDVMEADYGTTFEVEHISLYQWGWRCVGDGTDGSGVTCTAHAIPDGCRHHHAPTVEDVLRELVAAYMDTPLDDSNDDEFFSEYAAKLRLAEVDG